jgi:chloramphenicol 3-O-phosphotransferase
MNVRYKAEEEGIAVALFRLTTTQYRAIRAAKAAFTAFGKMSNIILLNGTSSAGKTTLAKAVQKTP